MMPKLLLNPFVGSRRKPAEIRPNLDFLLVDDDQLRPALWAAELAQLVCDAYVQLLSQCKNPTEAVHALWRDCGILTAGKRLNMADRPLHDHRESCRITYCGDSPPRSALPLPYDNGRSWLMGFAVNGQTDRRELESQLRSTLKRTLPAMLREAARYDLRGNKYSLAELKADYPKESSAALQQRKRQIDDDAASRRGRRTLDPIAMRNTLCSYACYRYAQAGLDHRDYGKDVRALGAAIAVRDEQSVSADRFRKRVEHIAEVMVANSNMESLWSPQTLLWAIDHYMIHIPPQGHSLAIKKLHRIIREQKSFAKRHPDLAAKSKHWIYDDARDEQDGSIKDDGSLTQAPGTHYRGFAQR